MMRAEEAYPSMAPFLKEAESENFKLEHFSVSEDDVKSCLLRDAIHGRREYSGLKVGEYVRLRRKSSSFNGIVMSDTWNEKITCIDLFHHAKGDVLIAGLGLGMVLLGIQNKPEVTSITVIEMEQEIIDLVAAQLPLNSKVKIIHADIFEYHTKRKFDTIYFDIWDNVCGDNWEEMKRLHARFKYRKNPDAWMSSWKKWETQDLNRRDY